MGRPVRGAMIALFSAPIPRNPLISPDSGKEMEGKRNKRKGFGSAKEAFGRIAERNGNPKPETERFRWTASPAVPPSLRRDDGDGEGLVGSISQLGWSQADVFTPDRGGRDLPEASSLGAAIPEDWRSVVAGCSLRPRGQERIGATVAGRPGMAAQRPEFIESAPENPRSFQTSNRGQGASRSANRPRSPTRLGSYSISHNAG